ncbi:MAG: hypothetical protein AAB512_04295 [Patescibacteria group bacterium]
MNKFKRSIVSIFLAISLVINPSSMVFAGNDPGLDAPSVSEVTPTPEPSPSSSPEITSTPSPTPVSTSDGPTNYDPNDRDGDEETLEEDAIHDAEREARWQEYQAWLATQGPGDQESTGGVDGGGNVGDTSIQTGDANANGVLVTSANTTAVSTDDPTCGACATDTSVTNSQNGSGSDNAATVNNNNNSTVVIDNDANVQNNLDFDANSGNNDASANVGDSEIITGDANVVVTVITDANQVALGVYQFDVNGNQNGDIILDPGSLIAQNIGNGSGSTNDSTINNNNTSVETINNDGEIINNIDIDANTGYNTASKNTGGDSIIETGDASVVANVINSLNTVVDGALNVVNIFGDMVGNIVQPQAPVQSTATSACGCGPCSSSATAGNLGNGSDSENNATVNSTNTDTTNMTNNATVENNLDLDGNTGGNTTSFNTGGESSIETGEVEVKANVVNVANINVSSGDCSPVYMVFINDVSGNWKGQILGAAPGTYFYTSSGEFYFIDSNGQLVAVNQNNGADSTNNATVNNTNTTTTNITNNGTVTNNINIDANTGNNEASKNTGGNSDISTGDANIAVNVINFINSNFSGRKVVMTLVNVFGSWLGNFVPAGYAGDIPNPQAQATGGSDSSSSSSSGGSSGINSNGGGINTVVIGGQTLSASDNNIARFGEENELADAFVGGQQEPIIAKYKALNSLERTGIPVPLRILLIMAPLALGTYLLRRKLASIALKSK